MKTHEELIDGMKTLAEEFEKKGMTCVITAYFGTSYGVQTIYRGDSLILQGLLTNIIGSIHNRMAKEPE